MKKNIAMIIVMFIMFCGISFAQTYDLNFVKVLNDGVHFDVKIQISGSETFKMATSNITFNFNSAGMDNPTLQQAHNFSTPPYYNNITVTKPLDGVASINIVFPQENSSWADDVYTSCTDVATVRFYVSDPSATSGLTFRSDNPAPTVVYSCTGSGETFETHLLEAGNWGSLDITLPVELSTFTVQFLNGVPTLYWRTESETDNIGWFIYRNTKDDFSTSERITDYLIEGYGTTSEPHYYIYEDVELDGIPGETYWYWIESVDLGGAFHRYEPEIVIIQGTPEHHETHTIPKQYGLHQNSPNPLSIGKEKTIISFILPKTARAEIKIYNIRGELVRNLYSGPAYGDTQVEADWDGRSESDVMQAPGIYLYQLKVDGKSYKIKRLIVMR